MVASIVMLVTDVSPGGGLTLTVSRALALRRMGIDTTLVAVTSATRSPSVTAALDTLQAAGTAFYEVGHRPGKWLSSVWRLRQIVRQHHADVILAHQQMAELLAGGVGLVTCVPVIREILGTRRDVQRLRLRRWLTAGAIAVSQRSAEALVENGTETADRVHVVYPPYESPTVPATSSRSSIDIAEASYVLLFVGRITEPKGAGLLPALLARLPADCVCVVVGEGPARQRLLDDAESLGVASRFRLVGDVADVGPFYALADVYVAPTWREGLVGYATLDALSVGTPVVVSDLPEVRELLEDRVHAQLVQYDDPGAWANAVLRYRHEPGWAAAISARGRCVGDWLSPEHHAQSLVQMLESL